MANMGRNRQNLFGYTLLFSLLVHPCPTQQKTTAPFGTVSSTDATSVQTGSASLTPPFSSSPQPATVTNRGLTSTKSSTIYSITHAASTNPFVSISTTVSTTTAQIVSSPATTTNTTTSTTTTSTSTIIYTTIISETSSSDGSTAQSLFTSSVGSSSANLKLILPLAICIPVGVLVVVAGIIIICCCYRRRQVSRAGKGSDIALEEGRAKRKAAFTPNGFLSTAELPEQPVKKSELLRYVKERQDDVSIYKSEFSMLPGSGIKPWKVGEAEPDKNRYFNIIPYDENRVCLKEGKTKSGYINASFIDGYKEPRAYIAAQGPMDHTIDDFWRMVWEQNCSRIAMVTNILEGEKVKCSKYWPERDDKEMKCDKILVRAVSERKVGEFIIRTFSVRKGDEKRDIYQFHFSQWPDQDVPDTCTSMLKFYQLCFTPSDSYPLTGPLLIHCSAGVGRTGTLIALDLLIQQMREKEVVDIPKCIESLRKQRVNMVQSTAQYILLHQALLEHVLLGDVEIKRGDFPKTYSQLTRSEEKAGHKPLKLQYNVLNAIKPKFHSYQFSLSLSDINQTKNRSTDILPMDNFIPNFSIPGEGLDCYINAVYVKGYTSGPHIATQMPKSNTLTEFWNLVFEDRAAAIIMLNNLSSDLQQYWPDDGKTLKVGDLEITNIGEIPTDNIQVSDLRITRSSRRSPRHSPKVKVRSGSNDKTLSTVLGGSASSQTTPTPASADPDSSRKVRLIRVLDWSEGSPFPKDGSTLVDVYQELERCRRMNPDGRIIVHCLLGAERSGVFCALMNALDEVKSDNIVDVFNAVKRIRRTRPEFVTNREQYAYLYELVSVYLKSSENTDTNRELIYVNSERM